MNKTIFKVFALAMGLFAAMPTQAQVDKSLLRKAEVNPFVNVGIPAAIPEVQEMKQETLGEKILREYKERGRELPASEEKILNLKPGKRDYVRKTVDGERPLTFTGFLQYNMLPNGLMALEYGYYKFSTANGLVREPYGNVDYCLNGRGLKVGDRLYGTSAIPLPYYGNSDWTFAEWDTDTWEPVGNHGRHISNDMIFKSVCQDPTTGKVYGWNGGSTCVFSEVDYTTMSRHIITSTDTCIVAMDFSNEGQLYGITENGAFVKIDKSNGKCTYVRMLDFDFQQVFESMTCDRRTGKFYLCASDVDWEEEELIGVLREVDVTTGHTTLLGYFPEAEEYSCLDILEEADDDGPGKLSDLFVSVPSEAGAGVAVINFTLPKTNAKGGSFSLPTHYAVYVNGALLAEGDGNPGDFVARVAQNIPAGRLKVAVDLTAKDDAGRELLGERSVYVGWVGADTPRPSDVNFTYDEASKTASVTWNGAVGLHGGRVDNGGLTYNVVRLPDSVKVAQNISGETFTESLAGAKYDGYAYLVTACQGGEPVGEAGKSNVLVFGDAYEAPYREDFSNVLADNQYMHIDGDNDGNTWYVSPVLDGKLYHLYSKTNNCDDWALTPPIHMIAGVAYKISFNTSAVAPAWPEKLSVACGQGTDPSTYTTVIPEMKITNNLNAPVAKEGEIKVTETGEYRFGFHCTSQKLSNALFVDDIVVTAGQLLITPGRAQNVVLTPAEEGELEVTIDFDAPAVSNDDAPLESLSRIEIYRGENKQLVTTINEAVPGQHYTVVDEDAVNGEVLYTIVAFNEAGAGLEAQAKTYVGIDAPEIPENVVIGDNLDGTATLSWDAPTTGQHKGYIEQDELEYNVFQLVDGSMQSVKKGVEAQTYKVNNIPQTGEQGIYVYGVSAANDLGESNIAAASPIVYGAPYTIPYMEGFRLSGLNGIWSVKSNNSAVSFRQYSGLSYDGDDALVGIEAEKSGVRAQLTSGKISLAGSVTPKLTFAVYGDPGSDNVLKVAVAGDGAAVADTLATINFKNSEVEDFQVCAIDLAQYKSSKYITISFVAELDDSKFPVLFLDDVNVRNVNQYDLAVYADAQTRTTAGDKASVNVTVHNVGEKPANGYAVKVYLNNRVLGTVDANKAVEPFGRTFYKFDYTAMPTDPAESKVWATVEYPMDLEETDNTTAKQNVHIEPSQLEAVSGLAAAVQDDKVVLSWNTLAGYSTITESFEGYQTFTNKFGRWTCVDRDGCATAGINGIYWPGSNQPQSFLTFNFREAGVSEALMQQNPQFEANNGTQFLACFKAINAPGNKNNDWLISPELSGKKQMISIYAESLAGVLSDCFEVLYSTTGNDIDDFNTDDILGQYSATKNDFSRTRVTLPEGAKYFAIHCNSTNGGILMLDDITYEAKQPVLVGYNVYCDGQLVGTAAADATSYNHSIAGIAAGQHTYYVTAIYEEGESGLSNPASAYTDGTGVDGITIDAASGKSYTVGGAPATKTTRGVIVEKGKAHLRK